MTPIFITGIGTGVGKTVVSAIVTEALQADYWKPVQTGAGDAGSGDGSDSEWVREVLTNPVSEVHKEAYSLGLPASPHLAARQENITIRMETILARYREIVERCKVSDASGTIAMRPLVIEGAGGILVPLNDREFMLDLVKALDARTILVSRNYLGSINHSLLTAAACKSGGIKIAGWIFNEPYLQYEEEIEGWSGIPAIAVLPRSGHPDRSFVREQAERIRPLLQKALF